MKKITVFLTVVIMFLLNFSAVYAEKLELYYDGAYHTYTGSIFSLYVNDKKINPPLEPIIFNDRALVPIREVFESLGQNVEYEDGTQKVTVSGQNKSVQVQVENNKAYVNGVETAIPDGIVPKLITKVGGETKTMVPVRFISENVGLKVEFDEKNGAIKISNPSSQTTENKIAIKAPVINKKSDTETVITINLSKSMENTLKSAVTSAGVLYFDVNNAYHEGSSQNAVNHGAVKMVRLGLHDEYTRVAIDLDQTVYLNNTIKLSDDKKTITVTIKAKAAQSEDDTNSGTNITVPETNVNVSVDIESLKNYTSCNGVKRVVLDPGHGGSDSGAVGSIDGKSQYEKTINLSVALLVKKKLEANGIEVLMTRSKDTMMSLDARSSYANKMDAAMYVSIHVNSAANAPKANGIEVFYASQNNANYYGTTSKAVATEVLNALIKETGATNRGVKVERHYVTRTSLMPAILIELGFISNSDEVEKLVSDSYQEKLANAISSGIIAQIGKIKVPARKDLAKKMVAEEIGEKAAEEYINKVW